MLRKFREYLRTLRNRKYSRERRFVNSEFMNSLNHSRVLMVFLPMLVWAVCSLLLYWQPTLRVNEGDYVLGQKASNSLESEMDFSYFKGVNAQENKENIRTDQEITETDSNENPVINSAQEVKVAKGEALIGRGEIVTEAFLEKYEAYKEKRIQYENDANFKWHILGQTVLVFILVIFFAFYLYHINPDTVSTNRRVALMSFMVIASVMGVFLGVYVFKYAQAFTPEIMPDWILPFFLPLGLVAVLSAVMMGYRASIFSGFFVVSIAALMVDESFAFVLRGMTVCAFAGLFVRGSRNYRSFFLRSVGILALLIILVNAPIYEMCLAESWRYLHWVVGLAIVNAVGTAMIALFIIFLMELVFNVTTNMSLMVLCDYNHPLLERLKREAPGTFFHSQMVATIAEDAAKVIEANPLKAKAAALYHDIGKIYKPQYFIENVSSTDNPHSELNPQLSSIIIRDHVKEGLELAGRYKLCRIVREAIAQHHGDDLVRYFYNKAQKECAGVVEADFRYNGVPAVEKEVTIVSLADMCEAASRALEKPTPSKIEELVNHLFVQRFAEHQLTKSKLTLEEVELVRVSFVHTIVGMRHGRISYK